MSKVLECFYNFFYKMRDVGMYTHPRQNVHALTKQHFPKKYLDNHLKLVLICFCYTVTNICCNNINGIFHTSTSILNCIALSSDITRWRSIPISELSLPFSVVIFASSSLLWVCWFLWSLCCYYNQI